MSIIIEQLNYMQDPVSQSLNIVWLYKKKKEKKRRLKIKLLKKIIYKKKKGLNGH